MSRYDDLRAMGEARRAADLSQGMICAPARDWAEQVITEMSMFPAGRFSTER
jgi:hypothetical protein